jgi:hypothetical protein
MIAKAIVDEEAGLYSKFGKFERDFQLYVDTGEHFLTSAISGFRPREIQELRSMVRHGMRSASEELHAREEPQRPGS